MYKMTKRCGVPVIETFENENVRITRYVNGEVETEIKPTCDPKVKRMYELLMKKERRCF